MDFLFETPLYKWVVDQGYTLRADTIPTQETMEDWQREIANEYGVTFTTDQPLYEAARAQTQAPLSFPTPGFTPKKRPQQAARKTNSPAAPPGLLGGSIDRKKGDDTQCTYLFFAQHCRLPPSRDKQQLPSATSIQAVPQGPARTPRSATEPATPNASQTRTSLRETSPEVPTNRARRAATHSTLAATPPSATTRRISTNTNPRQHQQYHQQHQGQQQQQYQQQYQPPQQSPHPPTYPPQNFY